MNRPFRWNADNVENLAAHGMAPQEAENVLLDARSPYPRAIGHGKFVVWGPTEDGTYVQVIFIYSPPGVVYVIHARPLTDHEKKRLRRQRR